MRLEGDHLRLGWSSFAKSMTAWWCTPKISHPYIGHNLVFGDPPKIGMVYDPKNEKKTYLCSLFFSSSLFPCEPVTIFRWPRNRVPYLDSLYWFQIYNPMNHPGCHVHVPVFWGQKSKYCWFAHETATTSVLYVSILVSWITTLQTKGHLTLAHTTRTCIYCILYIYIIYV